MELADGELDTGKGIAGNGVDGNGVDGVGTNKRIFPALVLMGSAMATNVNSSETFEESNMVWGVISLSIFGIGQ